MSGCNRRRCVAAGSLAGGLLVVVAGLTGCGGESTAPAESVASVVVTGVPTTTFMVGDSVRLVASAVNATGGIVSNQKVSWSSSAPTVAAVATDGLVKALGAGTAVITASAGGRSGSATITVSDGGTIGTQGGTLTAAGGAVRLAVPAGALAQATLLLVRAAAAAPADGRVVAGAAWELGPDGIYFYRAASLTLAYEAARVPSGLLGLSLQLYSQSGNGWAVVAGSKVDTVTKTVTGAISRSGVFAVRSTPVDQIVIRGAAAGGALYVGQTAQLTVALLASAGDSLPGRPMSWSSSDAGRVTVDATGKLTALAAGSATITAATDGKSASTNVTVLTRPAADFSGATDWTTFQANPQHTGYVDVALDPGVFRLAWSTTVQAGSGVQPVSTGEGKIFASTGNHLYALAAADGHALWSYAVPSSIGAIVDPPAYASGSVYLQTGGHGDAYIRGFDAVTGALRFQTGYGNQWEHHFAPVVVGQTVYMAGGYYGGYLAFSTTDGRQMWFNATNQYDEWTPALADGRVYAYTGDYSPQLEVADAGTGSVLYKIPDPNFSWGGWSMGIAPVLGGSDDVLATQGGRLLSFDLVKRALRFDIKSAFSGNVTVGRGVLYVFNNNGVEARRQSDGSVLWIWAPPSGRPAGTSIATRNLLFVSVGSTTYALDVDAHIPVWSYPAGGTLALSKEGQLLIAGANGTLTAIAVK